MMVRVLDEDSPLKDRISATISRISDAFCSGNLEQAKKCTEELKYWYSLRDHIFNQDLTLHSST